MTRTRTEALPLALPFTLASTKPGILHFFLQQLSVNSWTPIPYITRHVNFRNRAPASDHWLVTRGNSILYARLDSSDLYPTPLSLDHILYTTMYPPSMGYGLDIAAISGILGSISIACWVVVFSPQIIENYSKKSADGLSIEFIIIWLGEWHSLTFNALSRS